MAKVKDSASARLPPAKTLFLHIGTQKTGTTTLQWLGSRNRAALAARGVCYPAAPGGQNHVGLTIYAAGGVGNRDLTRSIALNTPAAVAEYVAGFPAALAAEVTRAACPILWLSNEHLSSRIRQPEQIARVVDILRPLAERIKVVIYLRHQPEYYLSTYSMEIKAGGEKPLGPPLTGKEYYYNYEKMLGAWAGVVGDENMVVRVFERGALKNGDVVEDFFGLMGVELGPGIETPPVLNPSLDAKVLQFLHLFRQHIPRWVDDAVNPDHGDIVRALESLPPGPRFTIPAETMGQIAEAFAASNARVAKRYLGREDGVLFAPAQYRDAPVAPALTVEQAVEIAAHIWRFKQQQINERRARRREPGAAPV
jgi:hypothetical protein